MGTSNIERRTLNPKTGIGRDIALRCDVIEEKFESPAVKEQVREMQIEWQAVTDNEMSVRRWRDGVLGRGLPSKPGWL